MPEFQDISTILSIVPVEIKEFKPGIYPGQFNIDACADPKKPIVYYVYGSKQMVAVAGHKEPIAIDTPSFTIAKAIVNDYNAGHMFSTGDARPGLTFVQGKKTFEEISKEFPTVLPQLVKEQRNWYVALVKMADNDWARYKSHKAISDLSKIACRSLALEREWLVDEYTSEMNVRCKACFQPLNKEQVVCHHCRAIQDNNKAMASGIKFAA